MTNVRAVLANVVGIDLSTVLKVWKRYLSTVSANRRPAESRLRITLPSDDRFVVLLQPKVNEQCRDTMSYSSKVKCSSELLISKQIADRRVNMIFIPDVGQYMSQLHLVTGVIGTCGAPHT